MYRSSTAGAMFAASVVMLSAAAFAADTVPADSSAVTLVRNGIAGSGNEVATPPKIAIKAGDMAITLEKTTLAAVATKLGGAVHSASDDAGKFAWTCYVSPAVGEMPATVLWFASDDPKGSKPTVGAVASEMAPATPPASCTALKAPLALQTGAPGVGAPDSAIDAALGGKGNVEPDGTSAWMFGSEKAGDGVNLRRTELKFRVIDGKIAAASVKTIYEPE